MTRVFHRRSFLHGLMGASIGLPLMASRIRPSRAEPGGPPRRLIVVYTPNGTIPELWKPELSDDPVGYSLMANDHVLRPLQAGRDLREHLQIVSGIDNRVAVTHPEIGDGHQRGIGTLLTGRPMVETPNMRPGGISVDQYLADIMGSRTPVRSLNLGVMSSAVQTDVVRRSMSSPGEGLTTPLLEDPRQVFDQVFGGLDLDPEQAQQLRDERRSVLDLVSEDLDHLQGQLGSSDRVRVQTHLDAIRDIEQRLTLETACSEVTVQDLQAGVDGLPADPLSNIANFPAIGQLQMDLVARAMACDATRVATITWAAEVAGAFPFLPLQGGDADHHQLSHDWCGYRKLNDPTNAPPPSQLVRGDGTPPYECNLYGDDARPDMVRVLQWYAEQFAHLVGTLADTPEADGSSLLDNTTVVWVQGMSYGDLHLLVDLPVIIAGGAGGYLAPGHARQLPPQTSTNDLMLTLLHAMGVEDQTFGDPEFCTGPIDQLRA